MQNKNEIIPLGFVLALIRSAVVGPAVPTVCVKIVVRYVGWQVVHVRLEDFLPFKSSPRNFPALFSCNSTLLSQKGFWENQFITSQDPLILQDIHGKSHLIGGAKYID